MSGETKNDIDFTMVSLITLFGAILMYFIIVSTQAWYYTVEKSELNKKVISRPFYELEQYRAAEQTALNGYRWIDKENGVVSIPIEQAIQSVAEEY